MRDRPSMGDFPSKSRDYRVLFKGFEVQLVKKKVQGNYLGKINITGFCTKQQRKILEKILFQLLFGFSAFFLVLGFMWNGEKSLSGPFL